MMTAENKKPEIRSYQYDLDLDDQKTNDAFLPDGPWVPPDIEKLPTKTVTPVKINPPPHEINQESFILGIGYKDERAADPSLKEENAETHRSEALKPEAGVSEGSQGENQGEENPESLLNSEGESEEENPESMLFTMDEIIQARDEAYNEGFELGLKEGREKAEEMAAALHDELLERVAEELKTSIRNQKQGIDELSLAAMRIFNAALKKLIPTLLKKNGADEIITIFDHSLNKLQGASKLKITFHPDHSEILEVALNKLAARENLEGKIHIQTDDDLHHGDVKIEWGNGGASRYYEMMMQDIEQAMNLVESNFSISSQIQETQEKQETQEAQAEPEPAKAITDEAIPK